MRVFLIMILPLSACSSGPVVMRPDGTKIFINPSVLEKSAEESAVVTSPDGWQFAYRKTGKDQTMVAKEGIRDYFSVEGVKALWGGQNRSSEIAEKGQTARQVSADSVDKARIDGDVKIKTFVPPEP